MDDSFLREVDTIAAKVTVPPAPARAPPAVSKGWTGVRANSASGSCPAPAPTRPAASKRADAIVPDSDDFDYISFDADALMAVDVPSRLPSLSSGPSRPAPSAPAPSTSSTNQNVIPSSRLGMRRTNSSTTKDPLFQVHLNFRRLDQTTKGKRWDRTAFAESGRRVDAAKGKQGKYKARNWARDDDDEGELDEEDDEPLVPGPKPLVDTSEPSSPFSICLSSRDSRCSLRSSTAPTRSGYCAELHLPHEQTQKRLSMGHYTGLLYGQLLGSSAYRVGKDLHCWCGHAQL